MGNAAGSTQAHYTDYPGYWGGLASERRGSTSSFYGFDPAMGTRVLSASSGAIANTYLYDAFGTILLATGSVTNSLKYGGQVGYYADKPLRLYVRARHYDVTNGRWLSRDPLTALTSLGSRYLYASNSPLRETDPSGLQLSYVVCSALCVGAGELYVECVDACENAHTLAQAQAALNQYVHDQGCRSAPQRAADCLECPLLPGLLGEPPGWGLFCDKCYNCCISVPGLTDMQQLRCQQACAAFAPPGACPV